MLKSSKNRDKFREKIIKELNRELSKIKEMLDNSGKKVRILGLTGSFARGDWHAGSDIDIIIVCNNVSGPHWRRLNLPSIVINNHVAEYHIYSPEEFEILSKDARMIIYDLFTDGIILYADKKYLTKMKRIFNKAVKEMNVAKEGNFLIRNLRARSP
ncbi:MAG: nucleotidyltransferase domain-containing protein [Candidatus Baldrarchaeia archaeon]